MDEVEKPFCAERAKQGRAACKKCKQKCEKDELRLGKYATGPHGIMKMWHHLDCLFEVFLKQRPNTKRLITANDLEGWENLSKEDQEAIVKKVEECEKVFADKQGIDYKPVEFDVVATIDESAIADTSVAVEDDSIKDNKFKEFRRLVADITNESSYLEKTALVAKMFKFGSDGVKFKGNIVTWCRLLLPDVKPRVYNLQNKQLVKLFSRLFCDDVAEMLTHLEQGDIGCTIEEFYKKSVAMSPPKKTNLTISQVDAFLEGLSKLTKEYEQYEHFKKFIPNCTAGDLKYIVRLIKHDLRSGAGPKHVLEGVHPDAYSAFLSCRDIPMVINNCFSKTAVVSTGVVILKPVKPMLAMACKSIEQAMKKCPNGMYSEIKYDGERVQVHKKDNDFKYYTRNLKPVLQHKVNYFKTHIPNAFPLGEDMILDCEVLMVDNVTGKPLPFGTLGVHKKNDLKDASVCLFVFDCIYFNGEDLTGKPLRERRRVLRKHMTEIPNVIKFSEMKEIHVPADLASMITDVLKMGLEGLVLKDIESKYEPGKRHWLKVKKDYLFDGAMADAVDLIVLGAWFGSGRNGGLMSVFLMGVYDPCSKDFRTVTKVHTGHDDKTLERLQNELEMVKISGNVDKVPNWLKCTKTMVPDFVAKDPKKQPIWEITGAEFSQQHGVHTANGISIRFPRVTKIRNDKNWESATSLKELCDLYKTSKHNFDGSLFDKELECLQVKTTNKRISTPPIDYDSSSNSEEDSSKINEPKEKSPKKRKIDDENTPSVSETPKKTVKIEKPLPDFFRSVNFDGSLFDKELECLQVKTTNKRISTPPINYDSSSNSEEDSSKINEPKEKSPKKRKIDENLMNIPSVSKTPKKTVTIEKPLPDFFRSVNLYLDNNNLTDGFKLLMRTFVAYGGQILQENKLDQANYILHDVRSVSEQNSSHPKSAKHVTIDWLKDSINEKKLLHDAPYLVKLNPTSS